MKRVNQHFLLLGNPNTGKSTLFSLLTRQAVATGNRPGVTVEAQIARFAQKKVWSVEDLPGIYYLDSDRDSQAKDQQITLDRLNTLTKDDIILNVLDCRALRRQLYLTLQLIELQKPLIIILNFNADLQLKQKLSEAFCSVVLTWDEIQNPNIVEEALDHHNLIPTLLHLQSYPWLQNHLSMSVIEQPLLNHWDMIKEPKLQSTLQMLQNEMKSHDDETALATLRYKFIDHLKLSPAQQFDSFSESVDKFIMHRWLGLPLFLFVMYTTFWMTIVLGGALTELIEAAIATPFTYILQFINFKLLKLFLTSLSTGLQTLGSFTAPLFILYILLGLLEHTGYMQRAALVIDKVMQYLKLPGQSFVPIIVGFGCNVPAIMSSRTLDYERDRIQTILMSPFMSCSARLAIFTVFANSFFGPYGYKIIFGLYVFGFAVAILTGLVVRACLGMTHSSPLIQELVAYRTPNFKHLLQAAWHRVQYFLSKAAKVILPVTLIIHALVQSGWVLNPYFQEKIVAIFEPIGLEARDWPAALSLFSGLLAKEVVIGTLEAFTQAGQIVDSQEPLPFSTLVKQEFAEALDHLSHLSFYPWTVSRHVIHHHALEGLFANQHAAISYLIFVLLYFPCISVTTAIARESRSFWAVFSVVWSTSLAYASALLYYQLAMKQLNLIQAVSVLLLCLVYFSGLVFLLRKQIVADHKKSIPFVLKHQWSQS